MLNLAILGAQWGDEGKGKIIDILSPHYGVVVRFQGGSNAGHTVVADGEQIILHQVPSGIIRGGAVCVIANGVVVEPGELLRELELLESKGIRIEGRFYISERAHLVLPYHSYLDGLEERDRGDGKIGTTGKGIGPAYEFKAARSGLRVGDLLHPDSLISKVERQVDRVNRIIEISGGGDYFDQVEILKLLIEYGARLRDFITDTSKYLFEQIDRGGGILFEGAQGTFLDIDHGTYPYVTSSSTTIGGVCTGTGIPPKHIHRVMGISKAYSTRVGEGPFPTEEPDPIGKLIREQGGEYGATTGRPRRCGWFDAVAARYAMRINGFDAIALTKADVLDGFQEIKVCVAYELAGRKVESIPVTAEGLSRCKPVYETLPGWEKPISGVTDYDQIPEEAKRYIDFLGELLGFPIPIISTGFEREHTVVRKDLLAEIIDIQL